MNNILSWVEYAKKLDMISFLEIISGNFALHNFSKNLITQFNTYVDKQSKQKSVDTN